MENRLFRRTIAAVMAVAVIGGAAVSAYGSSALSDNAVTAAAADSQGRCYRLQAKYKGQKGHR